MRGRVPAMAGEVVSPKIEYRLRELGCCQVIQRGTRGPSLARAGVAVDSL
jgi:hypothetical protein